MSPFQEKMLAIDRSNQESARIILAAPHLDLGSLEVQWARLILERSAINLVPCYTHRE